MTTYQDCRMCGSKSFERDGSIRTQRTILANKILECVKCSLVFLNDDSHITQDHYKESKMHESAYDIEESREETKSDDLRRYRFLESYLKDKVILEVGVGNGGFLKFANQVAKSISGVEPEEKNLKIFKKENLNVQTNIEFFVQRNLSRSWGEEIDVVVSFHVIEHVSNPLNFLFDLVKCVKVGGKVFIETPNSNDALITFYKNKNFQDFIYWDNHLVLFNSKSFEYMCNKISGIEFKAYEVQRYGLANHLYWLANSRPGGHKIWNMFESELIKKEYSSTLNLLGANDTLFYEITRVDEKINLDLL